MLTEHDARALLIRNGYKLDPNYTFYFPVVKDARFKDVKQLLDEAGYDGFFATTHKSKGVNQPTTEVTGL